MIGLCLLLLAAPALALPEEPGERVEERGPLGFQARAGKASVRLGEPFEYSVEIRHRPEERYELQSPPALAPFQAGGVRCRRDLERGEARTTCTMRLALFALGPADVPELAFDVDGSGGKGRLAVPGPRITAVGVIDPKVPAGSIPLRDIAPPVPLLVPSLRLLWWALAVLAAAAAAAAGVRTLLRARARHPADPEPGPAERFARRIEALEAERLPDRGMGSEHVARLSEAVREYLGALSGLPALDLTSAELLAALGRRASPLPDLDLEGVGRFLAEADLVKFARQPAGPERCRAGTEWASGLLERTARGERS